MKKILLQFLAVALGSSLGGMLRFAISLVPTRTTFPLATLFINITGSFFLGWFLTTINTKIAVSDYTRLAIAVGFVGAFTTFSTYMYESDQMIQDALGFRAILYLLGSIALGLLAVRTGILLARH